MTRRALIAALLLVVLGAVGCAPSEVTGDEEAVRQAVADYNSALVRAYEQLDMNELGAVATKAQAERDFTLMAALGEARLQMFARQTGLEFGEVTFSESDRATVVTTEMWDYDHISLDTSETVRSERDVEHSLRYELVRTEGRWLVDEVTGIDPAPGSAEEESS